VQVEVQNEDVQEATVHKEGYLYKLSGILTKKWKKRWAVLDENTLTLATEKGGDQKDFIDVCFCSAKLLKQKIKKVEYVFTIHTCNGNFVLSSDTGENMLSWISAIQDAQVRLMTARLEYSVLEKRQPIADEKEKNRAAVITLMKQSENSKCADCSNTETNWASINIGIFICIECAGIHRKLGTHITQVRSITMDRWEDDTVKTMKHIGNANSNSKYLAKFSHNEKRLMPKDTMETKLKFITDKYEHRKWC